MRMWFVVGEFKASLAKLRSVDEQQQGQFDSLLVLSDRIESLYLRNEKRYELSTNYSHLK